MYGQSYFQLIAPLVYFVFSCGFAVIWYYARDLTSARLFAIALFLRSVGFLADFFRPAMPPDVGMVATFLPYLLSGAVFFAGVYALYKMRVPWRRLGAAVAALTAVLLWFRFVDESTAARVAATNYGAALAFLFLAWAIRNKVRHAIDRVLQILFVANAAQFILRTAAMLWVEGNALTLQNYVSSLTAVSLHFALTVATMVIGMALYFIYGAEVISRLTVSSETDPLTGALNRRGFEARVPRFSQALDSGGPGHAFILADIDRFKSVNDHHGHDAGDIVLSRFARILGGTAREGDLVVRWGGEEFVIVLRNADASVAGLYAEAVRSVFEGMRHDCLGGANVTASFGIVEWGVGSTVKDVYASADQALYAAKVGGRNRVNSAVQGSAQPRPAAAA